jgi:hypothetical protein
MEIENVAPFGSRAVQRGWPLVIALCALTTGPHHG